uniref:RES domain-containing protein n=1 Tax=Georgenia sp. M64 TaxID=3120520 RepID=UPI00404B39B8
MRGRANAVTASGVLVCEDAAGCPVWRVGYAPDPWTWTPWQYAEAGRFSGRWDDPHGIWRSVYVGQSALACYLEVNRPGSDGDSDYWIATRVWSLRLAA